MSLDPNREVIYCHACGGELKPGMQTCWLCGEPASAGGGAGKIAGSVPPRAGVHSFDLESLFLLMTLAAVSCGLTAAAPGLGIAWLILLTPALINLFISARRRKRKGEQLRLSDKIAMFFVSLAMTLVLLVMAFIAAVGAFFFTCLAVLSTNRGQDPFGVPMLFYPVGAAGLAAIVTAYFVWRALFRERE